MHHNVGAWGRHWPDDDHWEPRGRLTACIGTTLSDRDVWELVTWAADLDIAAVSLSLSEWGDLCGARRLALLIYRSEMQYLESNVQAQARQDARRKSKAR